MTIAILAHDSRKELALQFGHGEDAGECLRQRDSQTGNGTGGADDEGGHTGHIGDPFAEGFPEVDIAAAGLGHHGAEFRIAEAAEQGDQTADDPDDQGKAHAHAAADQDIGAEVKDAGADHDAGKNADAAEEGDIPAEFSGIGSEASCLSCHKSTFLL